MNFTPVVGAKKKKIEKSYFFSQKPLTFCEVNIINIYRTSKKKENKNNDDNKK